MSYAKKNSRPYTSDGTLQTPSGRRSLAQAKKSSSEPRNKKARSPKMNQVKSDQPPSNHREIEPMVGRNRDQVDSVEEVTTNHVASAEAFPGAVEGEPVPETSREEVGTNQPENVVTLEHPLPPHGPGDVNGIQGGLDEAARVRQLFVDAAKSLGQSVEQVEPIIIRVVAENWITTVKAIDSMSLDSWMKLEVPLGLVDTIKEIIKRPPGEADSTRYRINRSLPTREILPRAFAAQVTDSVISDRQDRSLVSDSGTMTDVRLHRNSWNPLNATDCSLTPTPF